jgi:hypothetical protein
LIDRTGPQDAENIEIGGHDGGTRIDGEGFVGEGGLPGRPVARFRLLRKGTYGASAAQKP